MSATTPKVKLRLSFGNVTRLALSIPLDTCCTFAINPLKWLRFLGFAIYGQEGYLSTSEAGPEIDDYTADIEARSYCFISEGEARLVDADALDDRTSDDKTSDSSDLSNRQSDFRANVIERDGTCVLTGDPVGQCIACHIIPHAKGSNYMSNVVRHRGGAYDYADDIDDINDTRNGLLLHNGFHFSFGAGQVAFLKTPNFALTVDDIPYGPQRGADEVSPDSRLTLHYFVDLLQLGTVIATVAPHNTDVQQPQDTSEWPPSLILDLCYAVAAIKAWSPKSFIEYVRRQSKDAYYIGDDDNKDNDKVLDISGPSHVDAQKGDQTTGQSGSNRLRSRNKTSNHLEKRRFADLMGGVCALWMQSSRENKPKPKDDHASSLRNESVKKWLQSIEKPTTN